MVKNGEFNFSYSTYRKKRLLNGEKNYVMFVHLNIVQECDTSRNRTAIAYTSLGISITR